MANAKRIKLAKECKITMFEENDIGVKKYDNKEIYITLCDMEVGKSLNYKEYPIVREWFKSVIIEICHGK